MLMTYERQFVGRANTFDDSVSSDVFEDFAGLVRSELLFVRRLASASGSLSADAPKEPQ
jgi:hypothetical protein